MPVSPAWGRPGKHQPPSRARFCTRCRYGSAYDGYLVANQTLNGMLWLAQYEFATPERESKLGTLMWPEW